MRAIRGLFKYFDMLMTGHEVSGVRISYIVHALLISSFYKRKTTKLILLAGVPPDE